MTINERDREALAYARVTVPLGKQPKRIDCSRIYELEIEILREEVALLRMNAQKLQRAGDLEPGGDGK